MNGSDRLVGAAGGQPRDRGKANGAAGGPPTVASFVTEELRAAVLDGRYPAGSRLDQQALAEELGVSIIPVRESLRQLEAEGFVYITPRRGAFVVEQTASEVMELYKIRAVLEAFATREAVPQLTSDDLDKLQTLSDELVRLAKGNSREQWTTVNRAWHFTLYGAAKSPLLMQSLGALWDRCRLTSHAYVRDPRHRVTSSADHARILKAARRGDAEQAAQIVTEHVHRAMLELVSGEAAARPDDVALDSTAPVRKNASGSRARD